jgi:urease accessory protein UreF
MDNDWKQKEQEALNEGHHWTNQAGFQFDKTWDNGKTSYNLYKKGKLLGSATTAWKYRDLAYHLCPYYEATASEQVQERVKRIPTQRQTKAKDFIAQVIEAIEPETEEELLLAIADNEGCDWGLARSMFKEYQKCRQN